jgi:hypothetical protein
MEPGINIPTIFENIQARKLKLLFYAGNHHTEYFPIKMKRCVDCHLFITAIQIIRCDKHTMAK